MKTSRISGFYKKSVEERLSIVKEFANLSNEQVDAVTSGEALPIKNADAMVENVIGRMQIPLGVASNILVNGKEYFVPMATEEPSVIAAASNAARLAYDTGGVQMTNTGSLMQAQIQITGVKNPLSAKAEIYERKEEIIQKANEVDPVLVKFGGGARDIIVRIVETPSEPMVIVHLVVDTQDAMGANAVNTMAESLAPLFEEISKGKVYLRILTNLADKRLVRGRVVVKKENLGGENIVDAIVLSSQFAEHDPYRAATHNKGIMNGISAVVLATGNDTRAVEAGAHAYAARDGKYTSLTRWEKNADGDLTGTIEIPMAVGLVGGATASHPTAKTNVKILGVKKASELAEIIGAIGLLQNLAAVRVLATEGVQRGHMSLHSRNVAIATGAEGDLVNKIAEQMTKEGQVNANRAQELYKSFTKND